MGWTIDRGLVEETRVFLSINKFFRWGTSVMIVQIFRDKVLILRRVTGFISEIETLIEVLVETGDSIFPNFFIFRFPVYFHYDSKI